MKTFAFAFIFVVLVNKFCAAASGNTSGSGILLEDIGAKGGGLFGACSSFTGDITLLRYNPAGITDLNAAQLSAFYYNSGTTGINYGSITYGQNIGAGVIGLNISYLNGGDMELNLINGTTANVISEQDISGSVSLGVPLGKKLSIGASIKALSSTLIGAKTAIAFAGDAGAVYKGFILEQLNIGAAILNLGTGLKYLDTAEALPLIVQGGASYRIPWLAEDLTVILSADGVYGVNDKIFGLKAGVEGNYKEFSARIGIPLGLSEDTSFTAGAGYRLEGQYLFDYAVSFGKALGLTHRVSVGMLFGEKNEDNYRSNTLQKKQNQNNDNYRGNTPPKKQNWNNKVIK